MPRKLVYGTARSRGLMLKDPYWTQLIKHLHTIMFHSFRATPTHDLLQENMELVQLHVGSDQPFWQLPYDCYAPLAPDGWIKRTWEALSQTPLTLSGPDITQPKQREHDQHLMDVFVAMNPSPAQLPSLQD